MNSRRPREGRSVALALVGHCSMPVAGVCLLLLVILLLYHLAFVDNSNYNKYGGSTPLLSLQNPSLGKQNTSPARIANSAAADTAVHDPTTYTESSLPSSLLRSLVQQEQEAWSSSSDGHRPTTRSLHPTWKLWHELTTPAQQTQALERVRPYVTKYGSLLGLQNSKYHRDGIYNCATQMFGSGGEHMLCGPPPPKPCHVISFGINNDPSFDIALANEWGCRGFAGDPTVTHPSHLHEHVTFHNLGLTTVTPNEEKLSDKNDWWYTSMPMLRKFLKLPYVDVVKLDCEGCEIAFTRDILAEDPTLLHRVGQISIETHVTKAWIDSNESLYYFALLFPLLEEAGFSLIWSSVFGCNIKHENYRCMDELRDWGFPCGLGPAKKVARSCHDMLFARNVTSQTYMEGLNKWIDKVDTAK